MGFNVSVVFFTSKPTRLTELIALILKAVASVPPEKVCTLFTL
jgi:hypothetical protein